MSETKTTSRRDFVKTAAIAAAGFMIVPRYVLGGKGYTAPSDRLLIAGVGVGGKGASDLTSFYAGGKCDVAYLCDVDTRMAAGSVKRFPKAKFYKDWREMFDKESKNFDAVSVSTPDHNHAIITMAAMQSGTHVYVQKAMTHDIYEARQLTEAVERYKVVTQMGNQGASGDGLRQLREWYDAGLRGDVHTGHIFANREIWPQGSPWPTDKPSLPTGTHSHPRLRTAPYIDHEGKLLSGCWP